MKINVRDSLGRVWESRHRIVGKRNPTVLARKRCQARKQVLSEAIESRLLSMMMQQIGIMMWKKNDRTGAGFGLSSAHLMSNAIIRLVASVGMCKSVKGRIPEWDHICDIRKKLVHPPIGFGNVLSTECEPTLVDYSGGHILGFEWYGYSPELSAMAMAFHARYERSSLLDKDFLACVADADQYIEESYKTECGMDWHGKSAQDMCRETTKQWDTELYSAFTHGKREEPDDEPQ